MPWPKEPPDFGIDANIQKQIDAMTYDQLLSRWRFAPIGDPFFQGKVGDYFAYRMKELRESGSDHVGASKRLGWEKP